MPQPRYPILVVPIGQALPERGLFPPDFFGVEFHLGLGPARLEILPHRREETKRPLQMIGEVDRRLDREDHAAQFIALGDDNLRKISTFLDASKGPRE